MLAEEAPELLERIAPRHRHRHRRHPEASPVPAAAPAGPLRTTFLGSAAAFIATALHRPTLTSCTTATLTTVGITCLTNGAKDVMTPTFSFGSG